MAGVPLALAPLHWLWFIMPCHYTTEFHFPPKFIMSTFDLWPFTRNSLTRSRYIAGPASILPSSCQLFCWPPPQTHPAKNRFVSLHNASLGLDKDDDDATAELIKFFHIVSVHWIFCSWSKFIYNITWEVRLPIIPTPAPLHLPSTIIHHHPVPPHPQYNNNSASLAVHLNFTELFTPSLPSIHPSRKDESNCKPPILCKPTIHYPPPPSLLTPHSSATLVLDWSATLWLVWKFAISLIAILILTCSSLQTWARPLSSHQATWMRHTSAYS